MREHYGADALLAIQAIFGIMAVVMMLRWGISFWDDLNAGSNGRTASLMFFFFALANLFISLTGSAILQTSFVDGGPLDEAGHSWVDASFGLWLLSVWLLHQKMINKGKD